MHKAATVLFWKAQMTNYIAQVDLQMFWHLDVSALDVLAP